MLYDIILLAVHFDYYIYFPFHVAVVLVTEPISNVKSHYYGPIVLTTAKPLINVTGPVKRDQVNTKHIIS